jgi:RNA polymerase sigma-70 factor, ECF subfamily
VKPIARARTEPGVPGATRRSDASVPTSSVRPRNAEAADEVGLRDAYLTHGGELYGFARRMLARPANAEDAVQETFARAWRSRARFDPTLGSLRTWLFTIERRVIFDMTARESRSAARGLDERPETAVEEDFERALLGWQIDGALQRLQPEHRSVLVELYFNGRTGREVAELFGIPEGTVRSRAYYALRTLRLYLEESEWN